MTTEATPLASLKPLNIKCTSSACDQELHCFRATRKMLKNNRKGECRSCGAALIDWPRVHSMNISDAPHTINMLQRELIRHHFWHVPIDQKAMNHARRKGRIKLMAAVENRIRRCVGTKTAFDGRQTPKEGNTICYAQHATACCCRKCIEEWYDIPRDRPLTDEEIKYFAELCILYLAERLPDLGDHGEKVPPIRRITTAIGGSDSGR